MLETKKTDIDKDTQVSQQNWTFRPAEGGSIRGILKNLDLDPTSSKKASGGGSGASAKTALTGSQEGAGEGAGEAADTAGDAGDMADMGEAASAAAG